jgi:hypothetical protein
MPTLSWKDNIERVLSNGEKQRNTARQTLYSASIHHSLMLTSFSGDEENGYRYLDVYVWDPQYRLLAREESVKRGY